MSETSDFEVPEPILNTPFEEPGKHWFIRKGETAQKREYRRPSIVYPPRDQKREWNLADGTLKPSKEYAPGYEMALVNMIRERVKAWREQGYPGVTRTTLELLQWWRREGREHQLFFAQLEAAETVIFMREARGDFLQGINVPVEEVSEAQRGEGIAAFLRYACKMATGSGKTTVMGMLAAWSILNKVNSRGDARFSDVVLVVCPNVTIRNRLAELDPEHGEASLYRTRDLVPSHLMPLLTRGRVLTTNWHTFELQSVQTGGVTSKVSKAGKPIQTRERILIASKTTTARGKRYMTLEALTAQVNGGWVRIIEEEREEDGSLRAVKVESTQYVESDTHFIDRVMGREVGGKQNILVFNDEAHHAYRIKPEKKDDEGEGDLFGEDEDSDDFFKEATVWVEGLDRIHKHRGINFCVDLSATPYFLGRVGQDTNRPFPWVVSDFGLTDAIEAGLVKIPQLAVRDTTGAEIPGYFNIWRWMMEEKLTPAEKGGKKGTPKPEAVLKYAHHPIAILGGLWEEMRKEWAGGDDPRPPVFILVCKNTKIAKVIYEWLGEDKQPTGIPPAKIEGFRNRATAAYTIRVDSKVVNETDSGQAKQDESKWMRVTLDTVGKTRWPTDRQGVPIYPEGFEELARKLGKPLHPPGRDVRCIVSVGMLTEGWDCNTVTHIIGLRPFMSQLLCEQVVGRGLRRTNYKDFDEQGRLREEVAKVFGVPFEVIPYKQNPTSGPVTPSKRHHIHAIPEKAKFEIKFPRVEGYTQAIRNRIHVNWESVPKLTIEPDKIPTEVEVMGLSVTNEGRMSLTGKNKIEKATLEAFRAQRRIQEIEFDLATGLTNFYLSKRRDEIPAQKLFPQLLSVVRRYVDEKLEVRRPGDKKDAGLSPYYGWLVERLVEAIRPDTSRGESPEVPRYEQNRGAGSTEDVDFWSSKDVREVNRSHLNFVVADTKKWEQAAAYLIDTHPAVDAFVKNQGLGFAIPYLHNGQMHDYVPDFIIRLRDGNPPMQVILETKGFDPLEEIKKQAAERWVAAVNADGTYGRWAYRLVKHPSDILKCLDEIGSGLTPGD